MQPLHTRGTPAAFVLVWTSGYVVGALATRVMAPEAVTLWRFVVASGVMAVIAWIRRERWPSRRDAARYAAIGALFFGVQFGALYYGMSAGVPAATTALIACCSPLLVAAVSSALGWERLAHVQWVGIALGVVGVAVTLADRVGRPPHVVDLAWTLLGLRGLAGGTVLHGRMHSEASPRAIGATELLGGALPVAVLAPIVGPVGIPFSAHVVGVFLWLALVTGVGAPLLLYALIRERGAVAASSLLFVVPAVTALVSWPVLGQPVGVTALIGLVIAGTGLLLALRGGRPAVVPPGAEREPVAL